MEVISIVFYIVNKDYQPTNITRGEPRHRLTAGAPHWRLGVLAADGGFISGSANKPLLGEIMGDTLW